MSHVCRECLQVCACSPEPGVYVCVFLIFLAVEVCASACVEFASFFLGWVTEFVLLQQNSIRLYF